MNTAINTRLKICFLMATFLVASIAQANGGKDCPAGKIELMLDFGSAEQTKSICIAPQALEGILTASANNDGLSIESCPCWEHEYFLDVFENSDTPLFRMAVGGGTSYVLGANMRNSVTGDRINFSAVTST